MSRRKKFPANNESKKHLEADGWVVEVVERWIPHCFITKDCFRFADLLAMHPDHGVIMLVQVTAGGSRSNGKARLKKVLAEPNHVFWLQAGGLIQVHNWIGKGNDRQLEIQSVV